ncbi:MULTISPECIES: NAD(P)/FAD-dependent oxidoreductase [Phaeodactylibacter]|jgi:thioredoxin reductase (NADPH)|uniref:Ferredoxin--NADP reductase n=1 Tax=Phaeodactylibacter xiamenensis TaxID=1524460 RepID=A0A098S3F8_9BACT|nr:MULTISPECIES: NAD(P)/FAD-dependent oxidoreductase [Phaeodactylibacter]KGE85732.1 ferredoxin-NADP reductase [Phaeodactylibacter xiamenensis]MCI5091506.1 NAD(P)/FAD-dependent oxidoreductase [Phaeodactylibacter sp.]MCR9050520.1 NAD(P)/FAD-dependent oxidoreductase [bacterium]
MIQTDILIIGAGPCGLFTVFEAGLVKLRCHLVDALPQPGGQLSEIYPKKPIYDIPGYPSILAQELVDNLMEQIKPFNPGFTLGERAETIERLEDESFLLRTNRGTEINAPVICIAGGLGCFEPRKPPISNLAQFEDRGVDYIIRNPEDYRDKRVVVAGGGDSALDWTIFLADVAEEVTLIHRRKQFRAAPDSVEKAFQLAEEGRIKLLTDAQAVGLKGNGKLTDVVIKHKTEGEVVKSTDHFIPLFGLSPKLGPIADWGLNIDKNAIEVDTFDYSTNVPGIYAVGDINTYPGKLKLILCGFHEATLMVQSAYKQINPDKKLSFKYTTVNGVEGF